MELEFINFKFIIENKEIKQEGVVSYYFYGNNIDDDICASAQVDIDTRNNCITKFTDAYDTAKQLLGGPENLNVENIDIDDTLNIAKREVAEL